MDCLVRDPRYYLSNGSSAQTKVLRFATQDLLGNPGRRPTESWRSNLMILRHTIDQMYGNTEPRLAGDAKNRLAFWRKDTSANFPF